VEVNTIYNPWRVLTVDADIAQSQAFFTDHDKAVGDRIPEAVRTSASFALILHDLAFARGFTGSVRMRYFGARDLIEDGSQVSAPVTVFNARLGYDVSRRLSLGLEALNLLNIKYNDAEYYDSYRLKGQPADPDSEDGSYMGHVIHPGEPLEVRVSATFKY
jgi:outer membrane receptor protein involved in Fe transport